ncbi:hypothetical protein, partial [Klebsiella pneumoniae]|uniref:hypothetical protein n=1 Tax=Klebsiella pneumoniae TaxID=573 RepID=UPI001C8F4FC2
MMYPLGENMDKTLTVGVFKSMDFKPALLLNHCAKTSITLTIQCWDTFTRYVPIIEACLNNNITGKKTSLGFYNSDIEVDNVRLRGSIYVRIRDLSKHNKSIHLSFEEFHVLASITPVITRYIHQLIAYSPLISEYLTDSVLKHAVSPLIYEPIHSIYNKLLQEVACYRVIEHLKNKWRS